MPYRLNPKDKKQVQEKRNGKWVVKKTYKTTKQALAYFRALYINVTKKER
jgi:hypothetical protein